MNDITILGLLFLTYILLNFILSKKKIFIDKFKSSIHKSLLNQEDNIPLSGGILIILACIFLLPADQIYLKIPLGLVFIVGALSDLDILKSPIKRIFCQITIIFLFLFISKIFITNIRIEIVDKMLEFYYFKLFFTLFCLLILINGSNFLDGVNTLVIIYYILIAIIMLYLADKYNLYFILNIKLILLSLCVILPFNFLGKVYLGDSGSYLLSFIFGISLIDLVNNSLSISPYFVALLLWYPAYENLFSIIRKKIQKMSPSTADNMHFHQLLFMYFASVIEFNKKIINTMTGLIINFYNGLMFIIGINNISNTKFLISLIIFNITIYTVLYFILRKKLVNTD